MKDIKAACCRYPDIKLSINMALRFHENRHPARDAAKTLKVEFYTTTLEQAKASIRQQCGKYERDVGD